MVTWLLGALTGFNLSMIKALVGGTGVITLDAKEKQRKGA